MSVYLWFQVAGSAFQLLGVATIFAELGLVRRSGELSMRDLPREAWDLLRKEWARLSKWVRKLTRKIRSLPPLVQVIRPKSIGDSSSVGRPTVRKWWPMEKIGQVPPGEQIRHLADNVEQLLADVNDHERRITTLESAVPNEAQERRSETQAIRLDIKKIRETASAGVRIKVWQAALVGLGLLLCFVANLLAAC